MENNTNVAWAPKLKFLTLYYNQSGPSMLAPGIHSILCSSSSHEKPHLLNECVRLHHFADYNTTLHIALDIVLHYYTALCGLGNPFIIMHGYALLHPIV